MGFSEHGSVFEWWHKKSAIEAAGMKYIHAVECYLTTTLTEKIRDNYHCVLLAKNYSGFLLWRKTDLAFAVSQASQGSWDRRAELDVRLAIPSAQAPAEWRFSWT